MNPAYAALVAKVINALQKYPNGATVDQLKKDLNEPSESVLLHIPVPRSDYRDGRWILRTK